MISTHKSYFTIYVQRKSFFRYLKLLDYGCKLPPWLVPHCHHSTTVKKKDLSHAMEPMALPTVENGWYEWWEANKFFRRKSSEKFVMIFPPPNVTGRLHMGHALTTAVQDSIIRWNQMNGKEVVWIPGSDHAGIATQVVVERYLREKLKFDRLELGRERFLEYVKNWQEQHGDIIFSQIKRLGAMLDWDKAIFTMDERMNEAVVAAFITLFDAGLIYREKYIINWCCALQSAISDSEVEYHEIDGPTLLELPSAKAPVEFGRIYDISYPIEGSSEKVTISTTRPETVIGDVALMVHPEDSRYTHLHSKRVLHPFTRRSIPIVTSDGVSMDKGTGVVKVTPAHSIDDFSVGKKYDLPFVEILDDLGCIKGFPGMEGMDRFEARNWVLNRASEMGLLRDSRPHAMALPRCSRTGDVIEHRVKPQWFLRLRELNRKAMLAVEEGRLKLCPAMYEKVWRNFLSDERDWCISRQIWYGHRMPVFWASAHLEGGANSGVYVAGVDEDDALQKAAEKLGVPSQVVALRQETDVLDTWFSSSLIPFSVFGWPRKSRDFDTFYPTTLLETGHDILYFWVARMVMLGLELTGKLPFKDVLLHGLVCDAHGHKMSKSRGNVIDPMDVVNGLIQAEDANSKQATLYGADALRFSLCSYDIKRKLIACDLRIVKENFTMRNKLWQAVRFLLHNNEKIPDSSSMMKPLNQYGVELPLIEKWIMSCLARMVTQVNQGFRNYDLHVSTGAFKTFLISQFCDVFIEVSKPRLWSHAEDLRSAHVTLSALWTCLHLAIVCLSPFMPFLSEELYQRLPSADSKMESVMQCLYPTEEEWNKMIDEPVEELVNVALQIANGFRSFKSTYNINKSFTGRGILCIEDKYMKENLPSLLKEMVRLSSLKDISLLSDRTEIPSDGHVQSEVTKDIIVALPIKGLVDIEAETKRLTRKLEKLRKSQNQFTVKLSKVPPDQKQNIILKIDAIKNDIGNLSSILKTIQKMTS